MYVFLGDDLVALSETPTSNEEVTFAFANPTGAAIPLRVYVHGFDVPAGHTAAFTLFLVASRDGERGEHEHRRSNHGDDRRHRDDRSVVLRAGALTKYLGLVVYTGAAGMPATTIVRVDTP